MGRRDAVDKQDLSDAICLGARTRLLNQLSVWTPNAPSWPMNMAAPSTKRASQTRCWPRSRKGEEHELLVMGAYGHSRLRSLILGATTTEMIRSYRVPVLIMRDTAFFFFQGVIPEILAANVMGYPPP